MRKYALYIIILLLGFNFLTYSQNNSTKDFDKILKELEQSLEKYKNEEGDEYEEEYDEYDNYDYKDPQQQTQEEYLSTPIEKKKFNREKWNDLRREAIEEAMGEGGKYNSDQSPYGNRPYSDQDNPYQQNREDYEKHWNDKRGSGGYDDKGLKEIKSRPVEQNDSYSSSSSTYDPGSLSMGSGVSNLLIVILIIALAALIFYLFFRNPASPEKKVIPKDLEEDVNPSEIPKSELELRLEEAIRNGDYRKAIRIYFIFIIKGLSEKKWITWEKEKTNFAYLNEMRKHNLYTEFDQSVMLYEIVWYGKRKVDVGTYGQLEPIFKNLIKKIEK